MDFDQILDQAIEMLQRRGRISYRALKRQFDLDDDYLNDLRDEILYTQSNVVEDGERGLIWTVTPEPVSNAPDPLDMSERSPLAYTPQHLTNKILNSHAALQGERKQVTVLFCDLANSTGLAEQLGPERMHVVLNQLFAQALSAVHQYEGTVNQFLGDGFMALFGAPIAHEDHAQRAVLAALELQYQLQAYNVEHSGIELTVRMGLNTGLVVVGAIGDNLRMDYTAVGDTTNLAARMQQLAMPGTIWLTEQTHKLIDGYFDVADLGHVAVKGKTERIHAYQVVGEREIRSRIDVSREQGFTSFVGRGRELEILRDSLERAKDGHGQVMSIMGEAGLGKSRLLHEFRQTLKYEAVTYLEGHCSPYGATVSYLPIVDLLKQTWRLDKSRKHTESRRKIQRLCRRFGIDLDTTLPYVLHLLGIETEVDFSEDILPEVFKQNVFASVQQMVFKSAEQQPLVIVIEDLHWSDPTTAEFAAAFIERIGASKVLLVCTYRPEFVPSWSHKSYHNQIPLTPLSRRESRQMLTALLGTHEIQGDLLELLAERSEGVPFFLEELVRTLRETGAIAHCEGQWRQSTTDQAWQMPVTVHDVLMARIDRLPEGAKRVLQIASVVGREFAWELVEKVSGLPAQELPVYLRSLTDAELVYERGVLPQTSCLFKHALTRDVAYDSLLTTDKQALHEAVGIAIETLCADAIEEQYELLAHHFTQSINPEKAIQYLTLAGKKADALYAHEQAITFFENGLDLFASLPDREDMKRKEVELLFDLEILYDRFAQRDEQRHLLQRLVPLAMSLDDPETLSDAYIRQGEFLSVVGETQIALKCGERSLALKRLIGDKHGEARALSAMGFIFWQLERYDDALRIHEDVLQIYRELGDQGAEGLELMNLGEVLRQLGRYQEALACLEEALQLLSAAGRTGQLTACHLNFGNVYRDLKDYKKALHHYQRNLDVAYQIGYGWRVANIRAPLMGMATIQSRLGNHREALTHYREALAISQGIGDQVEVGATLQRLAVIHEILGEVSEAISHYRQALTVLQENGNRDEEKRVLTGLGDLHRLQLRDFSNALAYYRQSVAISSGTNQDGARLASLKGLGATCWHLGHYEEAHTAFTQALQIVDTGDNKAELAVILSSLGIVTLNLDRYEDALSHLQNARKIAKDLADIRAEGYILNAMGHVYYKVADQDMAKNCYQQALQCRQVIQDRKGEGWSLYYLGRVSSELNAWDEAHQYQEQALCRAQETLDKELQVRVKIAFAFIYLDSLSCADAEKALCFAQEGLENSRAQGFQQDIIVALSCQAMALLRLGNVNEALKCSQEAIQLLELEAASVDEAETIWLHHVHVLQASGQMALASRVVERVYERLRGQLDCVNDEHFRQSMSSSKLFRAILAERA